MTASDAASAEDERYQRLVGLFARIAAGNVDEASCDHIASALRRVGEAHQIVPDRVRMIWNHLLLSCVPASDPVGPGPETIGEAFADNGRALTDSLNVIQELRRTAVEGLRRAATTEGLDESLIIAGIGEISITMNEYMLQFSTGYFRAEAANRARRRAQQDAFVSSVLSGVGPEEDAFNRLGSYGLDGSVSYCAFRAHPETDEELRQLEILLQLSGPGSDRRGVSAILDGDLSGFVSVVPDELPLLVGVSDPVAFAELPVAFRRATRAFHVAQLAGREGVQSLQSLGILVSVMTDRDIAEVMSAAYLEPLRRLGEYGETILATVRRYVDHDCQIEITAKVMELHMNTVRYRIAKFEDILGVSLRDTQTLAEVWWAFQLPPVLAGEPPVSH